MRRRPSQPSFSQALNVSVMGCSERDHDKPGNNPGVQRKPSSGRVSDAPGARGDYVADDDVYQELPETPVSRGGNPTRLPVTTTCPTS